MSVQSLPKFVKLGYGEWDEEEGQFKLKENAPDVAKRSYDTYEAWLNDDVEFYDDEEEYEKFLEGKADGLFGVERVEI